MTARGSTPNRGVLPPDSLCGSRFRLRQHGGVAGHQDGRHRQPARAVVPGAVGVLRLRAPGHPAADPDGGASGPAAGQWLRLGRWSRTSSLGIEYVQEHASHRSAGVLHCIVHPPRVQMRVSDDRHVANIGGCRPERAEFSCSVHNHDLSPCSIRDLDDYEQWIDAPIWFSLSARYGIEHGTALSNAQLS